MRLHLPNDSPYLVSRYDILPLIAAVAPAAIGAAASLASSAVNYFSQKSTNRKQMELSEEANDYQKQLNERIMQREDTAYQRAVKDALAAGLSPLTVAGTGGAGAGGSVSGSMNVPQLGAPQIDPNTLQDAARSLVSSFMQERQMANANASQKDKQSHEELMLMANLDAQNAMLDKKISSDSSTQDKQLAQDWKKFDTQLQFTIDSRNAAALEQSSRDLVDYARSLGIKNFEYIEDEEAYKQALKSRCAQFVGSMNKFYGAEMISSEGYENYSVTDNASGSSSTSGSVNSSLGVPSVAGVSSSFDASGTTSSGDSHTRSGNAFQASTHKAIAESFTPDRPFPVFIGKVKRR